MPEYYVFNDSHGAIRETGNAPSERVNSIEAGLSAGWSLGRGAADASTQVVDTVAPPALIPKPMHPATTSSPLTGPDPLTVTIDLWGVPTRVLAYDKTIQPGTGGVGRRRGSLVLVTEIPDGLIHDFLFDFPGTYEIDLVDLNGASLLRVFEVAVDLWAAT